MDFVAAGGHLGYDAEQLELACDDTALRRRLPGLAAVGGCCGTDHRHVGAVAEALLG